MNLIQNRFKAKKKGGLTRHKNSKHKPDEHNSTKENILNIHNDNENYFSCNECSYKTKVTLEYINHAHSEKQKLVCAICLFQTPNGEGFISHLDLFH